MCRVERSAGTGCSSSWWQAHPQTARHRLHRIHDLFGDVLADPDARFEIEVALRERTMVRVLTGDAAVPHAPSRRRALSQTV